MNDVTSVSVRRTFFELHCLVAYDAANEIDQRAFIVVVRPAHFPFAFSPSFISRRVASERRGRSCVRRLCFRSRSSRAVTRKATSTAFGGSGPGSLPTVSEASLGLSSVISPSPSAQLRARHAQLSGVCGSPETPERLGYPLSSVSTSADGGPFDRPRPRLVAPPIFSLCSSLDLQPQLYKPARRVPSGRSIGSSNWRCQPLSATPHFHAVSISNGVVPGNCACLTRSPVQPASVALSAMIIRIRIC